MTSNKPSVRTEQEQDSKEQSKALQSTQGGEEMEPDTKYIFCLRYSHRRKAKHRSRDFLRGRAGYHRLCLNGTPGLMSRASHVRPVRNCKSHYHPQGSDIILQQMNCDLSHAFLRISEHMTAMCVNFNNSEEVNVSYL